MVSAHMDTIGFVVTYIDERGFLRFAEVGLQPEAYLLGKRVVFENGAIGVIGTERAEFLKNLKKDRMFIDIGAADRASAEARVKIGDTCAVHAPVARTGEILTGGWMDDRIGCFVLLEVIETVKDNPHDLVFVFTSQEEVGLRGARTSAYGVEPDLGLVVDVTDSADLPEGEITGSSRMGKGAAVKVMDGGVIGSAAAGGVPVRARGGTRHSLSEGRPAGGKHRRPRDTAEPERGAHGRGFDPHPLYPLVGRDVRHERRRGLHPPRDGVSASRMKSRSSADAPGGRSRKKEREPRCEIPL